MESQVLATLSKKMGIDTPRIVKKATEFVRLAEVRCGSLNTLNLNGDSKAVICLEIAAVCSNVPVDKALSIKLSGMTKKTYLNAYRSIEHVLDMQKTYTVHDLAVQFGCLEAAKLAEKILSRYKKQHLGQSDTDFLQPIFPAASLYSACRHEKRKIDKNKLLTSAGVKRSMFDKLCQEMQSIIKQLVADEKVSQGSKRTHGLLDRVSEVVEEYCDRTKHRRKNSEVSLKDPRTLEYEEWKRRILEAADKAIAEEKTKTEKNAN